MYDKERGLYIACSDSGKPLSIIGKMANRHGLIAGATGTGKTVTLQVMAETFCQAGVPCFMADMKGDLSGISRTGKSNGFIEKRKGEFGIADPQFQSCPVRFFDVFGEQGHPMRATVSQMGPQLLSRMLGLNDTQEGTLNIAFRIADERGLLLDDLKDLRAMLNFISKHASEYTTQYGNIAPQSVGAIQRSLLTLENEGGAMFFGQPSFDIYDLMQCEGGKGIMNVLAADKLMLKPKLYSTFLLWLLSELYANLPEVGDMELPKLVFFFDEAHMLFDGTSKALVDKIQQVIRLIRSKGVGIYFITQSPTDIPDGILGQLGNRIQHALRAYTPKDQKAVRAAATTFRPNPDLDTEEVITTLGTGEALVSFLDTDGTPTIVEKAKILFPLSQIGAVTESEREEIIKRSRLYGRYEKVCDRESAFEVLLAESMEQEKQSALAKQEAALAKQEKAEMRAKAKAEKSGGKQGKGLFGKVFGAVLTAVTASVATSVGTCVSNKISGKKTKSRTSMGNKVVKNATTAATRTLTRSILGNLLK